MSVFPRLAGGDVRGTEARASKIGANDPNPNQTVFEEDDVAKNRNRDTRRRHQNGERLPKLIRLAAVLEMTGLCRSAVYQLMEEGTFPRPLLIGRRAVRWIEAEVLEYIESRPRAGSQRRRG